MLLDFEKIFRLIFINSCSAQISVVLKIIFSEVSLAHYTLQTSSKSLFRGLVGAWRPGTRVGVARLPPAATGVPPSVSLGCHFRYFPSAPLVAAGRWHIAGSPTPRGAHTLPHAPRRGARTTSTHKEAFSRGGGVLKPRRNEEAETTRSGRYAHQSRPSGDQPGTGHGRAAGKRRLCIQFTAGPRAPAPPIRRYNHVLCRSFENTAGRLSPSTPR